MGNNGRLVGLHYPSNHFACPTNMATDLQLIDRYEMHWNRIAILRIRWITLDFINAVNIMSISFVQFVINGFGEVVKYVQETKASLV